jgi:hypothetical protein
VNRDLAVRVSVAILIAGAVGGCGPRQGPANPAATNLPTTSVPPSPAPAKDVAVGNIVPGGFGPVKTGETLQAALDTGLIERDKRRETICEGASWKWKGRLASSADIVVTDDRVVSLGLSKNVIKAANGNTVGSSYGAVKKAYGEELSEPSKNDGGQVGVFVSKGDDWIGFLFDTTPEKLADATKVVFIEVSHGNRPGLYRDGC